MSKRETKRRFDRGSQYMSYSQLSEWLNCGYRWRLGWVRHISGWGVNKALEAGAAIHVGLEAAVHEHAQLGRKAPTAKIKTAAEKAIREWYKLWLRDRKKLIMPEDQAAIDEALHTAFAVTARAIDAIRFPRWRTVKWKGKPMVEAEIIVPGKWAMRWAGVSMHLDWVAEDLEEGGIWVVDYKSRKQFRSEDAEEVNLQHAIYQYGLATVAKINAVGSLTFQMLSRAPAVPKRNKDGSMSRARIATDWATYEQALLAAGLNPRDYTEMIEKLDVQFFRWDRAYRTMREAETIWDLVVVQGMRQIDLAVKDQWLAVRNMSHRTCTGCWARGFCLAELRGDDIEFLLKTSYVDLDKPQQRVLLSPDDIELEED